MIQKVEIYYHAVGKIMSARQMPATGSFAALFPDNERNENMRKPHDTEDEGENLLRFINDFK